MNPNEQLKTAHTWVRRLTKRGYAGLAEKLGSAIDRALLQGDYEQLDAVMLEFKDRPEIGSANQAQPSRKKKASNQNLPHECALCKSLSPKNLELLKTAWLEHGLSAREIAEASKLPLKAVERHVHRCLVNAHRSRYERLTHVFDQLYQAVDIAHEEYVVKPNNYNANSYQGLVHALRGALQDLNALQSVEELAQDVVRLALNPLITKVTRVIIHEAGSVKEDMLQRFDEDEADRLINELVERFGQQFKEAIEDAQGRIEDVLSAKDKNRKQALQGTPAKVLELVK